MKVVYIVDNPSVAQVLVDPMRRAILELLRTKPMTQSKLASELGLSTPSLNHHMKVLRSKRLVVIVKREMERHREQYKNSFHLQLIFLSTTLMFFQRILHATFIV